MVTLFGIFEVGSRGLLTQQTGLSVTGNNIANANTEGYSRQRLNLTTNEPLKTTPGALSTGVRVDSITRLRDDFLDFQIRAQTTENGYLNQFNDIFDRIQILFQDPLNPLADLLDENPAESGLNALMNRFFNSFQELSNNPESTGVRATVRENAITLAEGFNRTYSSLNSYIDDLNQKVALTVREINSILERIGKINGEIARIEAQATNNANDARDLRDQLLAKLADLVPISVNEQPNGAMDVRVLGVSVVIGDRVLPFEAVVDPNDPSKMYQIINSVERSRVITNDIRSGKLGAILEARDELVPSFVNEVNTLAKAFIQEVNKLHSQGVGLVGSTSLSSENPLASATLTFNLQQLNFPVKAGSFSLRLSNSNGITQNIYTINFDPAIDSLTTLAAAIDAIDGVAGPGGGTISAIVTPDNRLQITTNGGLELSIFNDSTGLPASLGINQFFAGIDAGTMAVSSQILDPANGLRRIAASATGAEGDNGISLAIASLRNARTMDGNTATFGDFYRSIIAELGVKAQRNATLSSDSDTLLLNLTNRQTSVSGVSLDEEAVNLIRFQQAFNASARYITVVDSLIDRVVNGMGMTT